MRFICAQLVSHTYLRNRVVIIQLRSQKTYIEYMSLLVLVSSLLVWCVFGEESSNWAVLIAGSNSYYNYRHQSDVAHAYKLLTTKGGFPSENVIVMMYDDIAYNSLNPFPGKLFNEPGGHDVYQGIKISYNASEVTAENFLKVIQGIEVIPGKPVLKSGPNDHVFIYYSDHGATGLVAMPTGDPLYADDLINALKTMYKNGMYNQLVFYLEACESGSMFSNGLLPNNISVYATTAANPSESSYAYYYNNTLSTYMADEYSIRWMQDSTNNWDTEYEILLQQFINIKHIVNQSHPQKYGTFEFVNETIEEFQAYKDKNYSIKTKIMDDKFYLNFNQKYKPSIISADSRDVKLFTLQHRYLDAISIDEKIYYWELVKLEIAQRIEIDILFRDLVQYITGLTDEKSIELFVAEYIPPKDFDCLKTIYNLFENQCYSFNDYSLKYVKTLVNLCQSYKMIDIQEAIYDLCE